MKQTQLFPGATAKEQLDVLRDLDRSELEPLAFKIMESLRVFCEKIEVAGSIRRQRGTVNDIDIVLQPRAGLNRWSRILQELRRQFDVVTEKQGDKLAIVYVPFASAKGQGYVQLDLYRATGLTWGVMLLVRTGSKEHNLYLCGKAISAGMRLFYSQGLTKKGVVVAGKTEEEVFEALGMPYVIPQDREIWKFVPGKGKTQRYPDQEYHESGDYPDTSMNTETNVETWLGRGKENV